MNRSSRTLPLRSRRDSTRSRPGAHQNSRLTIDGDSMQLNVMLKVIRTCSTYSENLASS